MLDGVAYSSQFRDLDAYIASIKGADFRYTMTRPDGRYWNIDRVLLPGGLFVQYTRGGCGSILESGTPDFFFNLLVHGQGPFTALGEELDRATAVLMPPGSECFTSTPGRYGCYVVTIPKQLVSTNCALKAFDRAGTRKARTIRATSAKRDSVRPLLARFFANMAAYPEILSSPASLTEFRDELIAVVGREYGNERKAPATRRGPIAKVDETVISRAVEAIEAFNRPYLAMNDLAATAGVAERTLREGFNRYLGISPRQYMQLRTLHRACTALASGHAEETTVARVATDLGIWDLGRFALRYRLLFGELPSNTLRRSK